MYRCISVYYLILDMTFSKYDCIIVHKAYYLFTCICVSINLFHGHSHSHIYLRHIVLHYIVPLCGLTAPKRLKKN